MESRKNPAVKRTRPVSPYPFNDNPTRMVEEEEAEDCESLGSDISCCPSSDDEAGAALCEAFEKELTQMADEFAMQMMQFRDFGEGEVRSVKRNEGRGNPVISSGGNIVYEYDQGDSDLELESVTSADELQDYQVTMLNTAKESLCSGIFGDVEYFGPAPMPKNFEEAEAESKYAKELEEICPFLVNLRKLTNKGKAKGKGKGSGAGGVGGGKPSTGKGSGQEVKKEGGAGPTVGGLKANAFEGPRKCPFEAGALIPSEVMNIVKGQQMTMVGIGFKYDKGEGVHSNK